MKLALFLIVALAVIIPSVTGIRCYICSGRDSYCKEKRYTISDCSIRYRMDTCFKMVPTNYTGELTVTKLCHVKHECYRTQRKCEVSGKCRVFCCFTDLCNSGTSMASLELRLTVLLMLVSAVSMSTNVWS